MELNMVITILDRSLREDMEEVFEQLELGLGPIIVFILNL